MSARSTASAALALLLAGSFTGVASAEPAKDQADLRLTIAYEQAEYEPNADLKATVTIENVGNATAKGFKFVFNDNYSMPLTEYAKVTDFEQLDPGKKHSAVVVGRQRNTNEVTGRIFGRVFLEGVVDPTPADNEFTATTKIVQPTGAVNGTVYVDANRNGKFDENEGKAGIEFHSYGGVPAKSLDGVTNENGDFSFRNVPSGTHRLYFGGTEGFVVKPGGSEFTVESGKETLLELAAVRPVSEVLKATLAFDKDTYGKTDPVSVEVTLKNTGTEALTGVVAVCQSDEPDLLPGTGPGWAALAPGGPGVVIGAGETKTVKVADVVPDGAYLNGSLTARCEFGNNGKFANGYAEATDRAAVVGALGSVKGNVKNDGKALVAATLVALNTKTRAVLGRATTDTNGEWTITGLPAGSVNVVVLGPWKDRYSGGIDHLVRIVGNSEGRTGFEVVPGPEVPDPAAVPKLRALVEFTADTFEATADATLKVTLNNDTGAPVTAIARCDTAGDLHNDTDGWGVLKLDGPGVELKVNETKVIAITAPIPQAAKNRGQVAVECAVGPKVGTAFVTSKDTAAVVGVLASPSGSLLQPDGKAVANTKIVLVDQDTAKPVTRATTDADGKFTFINVPVGRYRPVVVGPWKVVDEGLYQVVRGSGEKHDIHVEPGPDVTDPEATTPPVTTTTTTPPADGGGNEQPAPDDLAYTGASVIGIALLGGLVLALGLGAVFIGRRRGKAD
ncbi:MAG: carboxypeptidase regulatory-like domain-containing protein [Umezawaea sp.]